METATGAAPTQRETALVGQTVVVIGGSAGIGLEAARLARAEGAELVITGRNTERLESAAREVGAGTTEAFDATDAAAVEQFFQGLPEQIDHVMVTAGAPRYGRLMDMDLEQSREALGEHLMQTVTIARNAIGRVRPGGALLFIGGTGGRRAALGMWSVGAVTAAMPALVSNLALELAPIRVNLIAPGFVDTPLSAALLGDDLDARREQLRTTLPIGRVVGPADVAALAIHLMTNTALTGATYDIDGGQQFV
jgi:NAD(P)-dependent dehydrogenase (short-subunit alcohol dehydrogenase family)